MAVSGSNAPRRRQAVTLPEAWWLFALPLGAVATPVGAALPCVPTLQWVWDGVARSPGYPDPCCTTPVVAQLTDDDGDGDTDAADIPDVVFLHFGAGSDTVLSAVDGRSGATIFDLGSPILRLAGLAVADLDRDGFTEIVAIDKAAGAPVILDHNGAQLYLGDTPPGGLGDWDVLALADLDQDGSPEIIAGANVFDRRGRFVWRGLGTSGSPYFGAHIANAADIDPASPGLEVIAGPTLYSAAGAILWQISGLAEAWSAVGDVDGDGLPEVLLATTSDVNVVSPLGSLRDSYAFPGTVLSPPLVVDLDGDGADEVVVTQALEVRALSWSGGRLGSYWTAANDDASRMATPAAFDFDGDNRPEIVHHDEQTLRILDGTSGATLDTVPLRSGSGFETPLIADLDGDCETEILVSSFGFLGSQHVRAYECRDAVRARAQWNQHSYHVTNVDDDATVPAVESPSWSAGPGFLAQAQEPLATALANAGADATVCRLTAHTLDASASSGCAATGFLYRWLDGTVPVCAWSPLATCDVTPAATVTYSLEVSCAGAIACGSSSDSVTVTVRDCQLRVTFATASAARAVVAGEPVITVRWTTTTELDSVLFVIERASSHDGPFTAIGAPVPAMGAGFGYELIDGHAPAPSVPWYRIVEHDASGRGDVSPVFTFGATAIGGGRSRRH